MRTNRFFPIPILPRRRAYLMPCGQGDDERFPPRFSAALGRLPQVDRLKNLRPWQGLGRCFLDR